MFESTLAVVFAPGSNAGHDMPGANRTFFLPRGELGRVLYLGVPQPAAIETLARVGRPVTGVC